MARRTKEQRIAEWEREREHGRQSRIRATYRNYLRDSERYGADYAQAVWGSFLDRDRAEYGAEYVNAVIGS